jgi:hypothetical protein
MLCLNRLGTTTQYLFIIFIGSKKKMEQYHQRGANDFADHLYSSASYYEKGIKQYDKLLPINEVLL